MNKQERRQQIKNLKRYHDNTRIYDRHRTLNVSVSDMLKYQKDFYDFQKYSTTNAIHNGYQHSLKNIKDITRIEISSDMYESYYMSLIKYCNRDDVYDAEEYFKFCIPPYSHGVLKILGQDDLWREWWVSNITESSYDLRIDTYIMSTNLYGKKSFVGVNDDRVLDQSDSCPTFLIRTYSLHYHCYLENNKRIFDYDTDRCITWNDFLESMFQAEFNNYKNEQSLEQLKALYNFTKQTYYIDDNNINIDGELIINEFSDAIASFNYAAEINQCIRKKQNNNHYIYEYKNPDSNEISHEFIKQRQLTLSVENQNVCRIKSNDPNLLKNKNHCKKFTTDYMES